MISDEMMFSPKKTHLYIKWSMIIRDFDLVSHVFLNFHRFYNFLFIHRCILQLFHAFPFIFLYPWFTSMMHRILYQILSAFSQHSFSSMINNRFSQIFIDFTVAPIFIDDRSPSSTFWCSFYVNKNIHQRFASSFHLQLSIT